jgi:5-methylcytosine-specific restriction protein B
MLNYKDYEKKVYDWLLSKHQQDPNFTFSLRQIGSKGAETDYFIGTEKSRYFSTTFWNLPVSFPGSSGDCLTLLFEYTKTGYHYFFEFTQTKAPHNEQNKGALALVQQLQGALVNQIGFQREPTAENKMFSLRTKTPKSSYETVEEMFVDIEKDLAIIFPVVDEAIANVKKDYPDFEANRLTVNEFEEIIQKFDKRIQRFENGDTDNETAEDLEKFLKKFDANDVAIYFDFLKEIIDTFELQKGDERLQFSFRNNGLFFTIGQRFCWYLNKYDKKGKFGVITKDKINETSSLFRGAKPIPWFSHFEQFRPSETEKKSIFDGITNQLNITKKSSYRSHNSNVFETTAFNHIIGNPIETKQMETKQPIRTELPSAPLNQILYGPPGTGKTYNTVLEAAKIITGNELIAYDEALTVFRANLDHQIEFITFHQNYSYEDFIQGLRPDTENGSALTFEKKDGVFKRIADRAYENLISSESKPNEYNRLSAFIASLERLKEKVIDSEQPIHINETAYIVDVEENAFRYTGKNWTLGEKGFTGFRMKYADLIEIFKANVETRQEIKQLNTVSGLAKQHASYFLKAYQLILSDLKENEVTDKIERKNYVIIIDEINRANISRVFGELITLIEEDKRSHGSIPMRVTLPSGDSFIVPSNLYIIGTMNTADKSIALLDIALRRRFEFVPKYPLYDGLERTVNDADKLRKINEAIVSRKNHDFTIGHAYFMGDDYLLEKTINHKVIPLLLEYFMNSEKEVIDILKEAGITIGGWPLKMIS